MNKNKINLTEFNKLRDYLIEHRFDFVETHRYSIFNVLCKDFNKIEVYENDKPIWSTIISQVSIGYEGGLLEVMGNIITNTDDTVKGYLTANDIIKMIESK